MPTNHLKTRNRRVNFSVVLVKTGPALKKAGSFCMNNVYTLIVLSTDFQRLVGIECV